MPQTHIQTISLPARGGWLARVLNAVTLAASRRRHRRQLGHLDTHLLRDIGLDPQEARQECAKPFWQP